jgi:hypothetical protein
MARAAAGFRVAQKCRSAAAPKRAPREEFSRMVGSEELVEAGLVQMQAARDAKSESAGQRGRFAMGSS